MKAVLPTDQPPAYERETGSADGDGLSIRKDRFALLLGDDGSNLIDAVIDQIPDFLFVKDRQSRFVLANSAIAQAYGVSPRDLLGLTDYDLHPQAVADTFFAFEQAVLQSGRAMLNMEESFPDSEGQRKFYSTTKVPLRNSAGEITGLIGVARDITERKRSESFNQQQNAIFEMIAGNAPLGEVLSRLVLLIESQLSGVSGSILLHDPEAGCLRHGASPSLSRRFGQVIDGLAVGPEAASCGTAAFRREPVIVSDIQTDPLWKAFKTVVSELKLRSCWSTPILSHDGTVLATFALYSAVAKRPTTVETKLVEVASRIAEIAIERHRSEARLVRMAHHDPLTGLPNRTLLLKTLRESLDRQQQGGARVALHLVDLDGFKRVNDQLGHQVGDALLLEVGARLQRVASQQHTVARLGGDEFAVVQTLQAGEGTAACRQLAEALIDAVCAPCQIRSTRVMIGASAGIALAESGQDNIETFLRQADLALYRAKENRGAIRFYEPEMSLRVLQRRSLEDGLQIALERGQFALNYQPIIDLASNGVSAFEALLRWNDPERGIVSPQHFIPVAEEMGLIVPIGEWVLRQACAEAARWPEEIKVAVNLSPAQFRHEGLFQAVLAALSSTGIAAQRLELEITESVMLLDSEANLVTLRQLRDLGIQISLDDFGTGYSSMSYLQSFPLTRIKIDQSFVRALGSNPGCLPIVKAITRLATDLGMKTTAEGIETRSQLDQLRAEGCHDGQGYLFSRPLPADQLPAFLLTRRPETRTGGRDRAAGVSRRLLKTA